MKKETYKKAEPIIKKLDNIEKLIENYDLGWNDETIDFAENSDNFHQGNFFVIKNYNGYHSTVGGHSEVSRVMICEFNDASGAKYHLNKQETIRLQEFVLDMLTKRKKELVEKLESI